MKRLVSLLLVLSYVFSTNDNSSENPFEEIVGVRADNMTAINRLQNYTDITFFLFLYKKSSAKSKALVDIVTKVSKELDFMASFIHVDCDRYKPGRFANICEDKTPEIDTFPKMKLMIPRLDKIDSKTGKKQYHIPLQLPEGKMTEISLYNYITSNIPSFCFTVNSKNIEEFTSMNYLMNKVILFTNKDKHPLMFRGLSNYFFDQIHFGVAFSNDTDLLEEFNITTFPTIIGVQTQFKEYPLDRPAVSFMEGNYTLHNVIRFVANLANPDKMYERNLRGKLTRASTYDDIFVRTTTEKINDFFLLFPDKNIFVYLAIGFAVHPEAGRLAYELLGNNKFLFINCEDERENCMSDFKTTTFPHFVMLKPGKNAYDKQMYVLPMEYNQMLYKLYNEFKHDIKETKPENSYEAAKSVLNNNRVPALYFYTGDFINPALFFFSTETMARHIDFIGVKDPPKHIMEKYKIDKIPALITFIKTEKEAETAEMLLLKTEITYVNLRAFFDKVVYHRNRLESNNHVSRKIMHLKNYQVFNDTCVHSDRICLFAFLDARENKKERIHSFKNQIRMLERISDNPISKSFNLYWVNATCDDELAMRFNILVDYLPDIAIYFPNTEIFSTYSGNFDKESIIVFMEKFLNWETTTNKLKARDVLFANKRCEEIQEAELLPDDINDPTLENEGDKIEL